MVRGYFKKLERMYSRANTNAHICDPMTIGVLHENADVGLEASKKYFHALGYIHGSVYFKLLDEVGFFAGNRIKTS